jgi:predicted RNA binding protein YcfA (HicA-like mRNA interferase family)
MTKRDKLRSKLRNNPKGATMKEIETLLLQFGFTHARTSGSHHIFEYDDGNEFRQVIIPLHGRKVKKFYVIQAVELIDELFLEKPIELRGDDQEDSNEKDTG